MSQGKSRIENPVELTHCKDHRAYYVALSRSFTAAGTVIVQGFNARKITSGISGYLRQELRELEILDEITRLRFEGLLPRSVTGLYRRRLLRSYYAWKTDYRDPHHFHPSLRWDKSQGPRVPSAVVYSEWRPSVKFTQKRKNAIVASGQHSEEPPRKRAKLDDIEAEERAIRLNPSGPGVNRRIPMGLKWDSCDYSCGYDATFTILADLWLDDGRKWTACFHQLGSILGSLGVSLQKVADGSISLEQARDAVRRMLNSVEQAAFPYGPNDTSIDKIAAHLLPSRHCGNGMQTCPSCGFRDTKTYRVLEASLTAGLKSGMSYPVGVTLQQWVNNYLGKGKTKCSRCRAMGSITRMVMQTTLFTVPALMIFDILHDRLIFSEFLVFDCNGRAIKLRIRGIVYGGGRHFTARIIERSGAVWFHDGITTGSKCIEEINFRNVPDPLTLHKCGEKTAVSVIYARDF
ncbi:hypothetical protein B0H16DRAFT_1327487 [Mycena metata]|uniref:Uncharacterized protein n=1 Tax=Mycena metata TaxID=1033252 RepID=A0AAD7MVX7_9AGAR|nr:hypothetical protein B0H16DRAFT_1327487 [Mycena metata]